MQPRTLVELFARTRRPGWTSWGDEVDTYDLTRPLHKGYGAPRLVPVGWRQMGLLQWEQHQIVRHTYR